MYNASKLAGWLNATGQTSGMFGDADPATYALTMANLEAQRFHIGGNLRSRQDVQTIQPRAHNYDGIQVLHHPS